MSSLKDVSAFAGVTISTVSRYLSGKLNVLPETEARILDAIKVLDYRPNSVARALKLQRTTTVGIIVPSSTNPIFAEIVSGVYSVLSSCGYDYIPVASERDTARELHCFRQLQERQVDGILVIGNACAADHCVQWEESGAIRKLPTVFINRCYDDPGPVRVLSDLARGAYLATEHLCRGGRRRVAMVSGVPALEETALKERGYLQALRDHGLGPGLIRPGFYRYEDSYQAARQLFQLHAPDAVLGVSDLAAIAALNCAVDMGLRVPQDVGVVGFGNSEVSAYTFPTLTTVDQHKYHSGQRGAHLLLDLLDGRPAKSEFLPPTLIVRGSA